MSELEFNIDNSQIGFRLQYMELLNWGTFHNDIWRIDPNGNNSLLTGSIGSGKSTLVDALTSLIVPHHKINFNKAAGAEKNERNLVTFPIGEGKPATNQNLERLSESELKLYNHLRHNNIRLEQEKITQTFAEDRINNLL